MRNHDLPARTMGVAKEEEAVVVAEVVPEDAHPRKSKDAVGDVVGVAPDTRVSRSRGFWSWRRWLLQQR